MIQAPVVMPAITKHWDEKRGRMVLLLKNGDRPNRDVTVEDAYPSTIAGVLCFAKSGGIAPIAVASNGRITWKVANLQPGDVKELVYTSLSREALKDPNTIKRPMATDAALLSSMSGVMPRIVVEETAVTIAAPLEAPVEKPPEPRTTPIQAPAVEKHGTVIAVGAGKGGTGKTTFSINLGVALSEMGHKTVLMDADASMSNLSTYIGMDPGKMRATLHDVLAGEAEPDKAMYKVFNERLRVVPSGLSIEGFLKMDRELLKDVIEYFSRDADFIVIDTPAGYNKEVALSLLASDHLILVLNPDEGSMTDGLKVQEMARILGVNVLGIVLNRYDMKNPQFTRPQIEEHFGTPIIAMLPDDPEVRRKDKTPVVLARPSAKIASETYAVAARICGNNDEPSAPSFVSRLMDALFRNP